MRKFDSELFGQIKLQRLSHYRGGWAVVIAGQRPRGGGGGTPIHYQEPIITLPIRVCAAQRGRDFEAPDLEWGIHFRGVF